MNSEYDDFSNAIDNIKVERKKTEYELTQLKLKHYYWNSGDVELDMPISTSIELTCEYNFAKNKLDWKKTISHTCISRENINENTIDTYTQEIENPDTLIQKLEQFDLRNLKNNYFTNEAPNRFTHWEITYNNYFKIVGTYDQEIEEFTKLSNLLEFKKLIEEETKKFQVQIENSEQ